MTRSSRTSPEILAAMTGLPEERFECDVDEFPSLDELSSEGDEDGDL